MKTLIVVMGILQRKEKPVVLEYGSGGSTKFFSKMAGRYYAVESSPAFYHDVSAEIAELKNALRSTPGFEG